MRFVVWAIGVQQIRYLLPLFPALCLLTSHVLIDLVDRMKQWASLGRILSLGLVFGMVASTLTYSILFFAMVSPLKVILGIESKEAFLDRMLPLFEVTQFIETRLPEQARVMMLWDGRGFYCDQRCLPDFMQSQWTYLVSTGHDVETIALKMKDQGVSSLLYSQQDMNFISQHDVSGKHLEAARFLVKEFIPACTRQIYKDDYYELLELTCP
jgi:hypothetical protein